MGIPVFGALSTPTRVNRRQTDNLPPHVKGRAYFRSLPRSQGRPHLETGYYIDVLGPDGQQVGELPLEFVTTDEFGDHWATLQLDNDRWYITEASLVTTDNPDLGW